MTVTARSDRVERLEPPARRDRWRGRLAGGLVSLLVVATAVTLSRSSAARSGIRLGPVDPVVRFLVALALIVLLCHLLGVTISRLGQPPVVGEIIGGIVLGPSVLGPLWPAGRDWLFAPDVVGELGMAAQLGLVTYMFLLGCEFPLRRLTAHRRSVGLVVAGGMTLPFACGSAVAVLARPALAGPGGHGVAYPLFLGLAVSITALPVLARILADTGLDRTDVGVVALSSAAIGDGVSWGVLVVVMAIAGGSYGQAWVVAAAAVGIVAAAFVVIRPALCSLLRLAGRHPTVDRLLLPVLVAGAAGFAALTQLIGLHPVIGAFLFGIVVPRSREVVTRISHQLHGFAVTILLPVFFAGVGLSTSVGLLSGRLTYWLLFAGVLAVAVLTKLLGAAGGARLAGMGLRDSLRVGAVMNCRGVTELVVATVGLQYQIINRFAFTILVLVALVTTAATSPLLWLGARLRTPGRGRTTIGNPR